MQIEPEKLTREELQDIQERAPGIAALAKAWFEMSEEQVKELFAAAQAQAARKGVHFSLPACMGEMPAGVENPVLQGTSYYMPPMEPIDMAAVTSLADLRAALPARKIEYPSVLGQLVREGRFDEVLTLEESSGQRLTPDDYELHDSAHDPSVIGMLTQQGKLKQVFAPKRWEKDPDGFRKVAEMVPAGEFERQVGMSLDEMETRHALSESAKIRAKYRRPDKITEVSRSAGIGR